MLIKKNKTTFTLITLKVVSVKVVLVFEFPTFNLFFGRFLKIQISWKFLKFQPFPAHVSWRIFLGRKAFPGPDFDKESGAVDLLPFE